MSGPVFDDKYKRPSIGYAETIKKGLSGAYVERGDHIPFMFRALVIAVDEEGGKLQKPDAKATDVCPQEIKNKDGKTVIKYDCKCNVGPKNPRGSVKARILSNSLDDFTADQNLLVYWPLFTGLALPTPLIGDLVYVAFEDEKRQHGLWISKVTQEFDESDEEGTGPGALVKNSTLFTDPSSWLSTNGVGARMEGSYFVIYGKDRDITKMFIGR